MAIKHEVTLKSGAKGWQGKVREVYRSLEELQQYQETYGVASRLGYSSCASLWRANPTIQGGTNPADLRVVQPYGEVKSRVPSGFQHVTMWAPLMVNFAGGESPDLLNLREKKADAFAEGQGTPIKVIVVWKKQKKKH
jgi:hypothetical protein